MGRDWIRAATLDELPDTGGRLVRHEHRRIAVFRLPAGVFATDDACPHEGYALRRGDARDGVLTCQWHNWKFRLDDGACLHGGEGVRTYPVEVRGDEVWLDVTEPEREELEPQLFASLTEALGDVDIGRLARDTMRLRRLGTPLAEVVRQGVAFGAPRMEYGWNHSLAALTDCLGLAPLLGEGPLSTLPVVQGLSVVSQQETRRPLRPRPDPVDPVTGYGSVEAALSAYPRLVDDEDAEAAEALLRGLIAADVAPTRIVHVLLVAATDHFLSYGHPLIYLQKGVELLQRLGWEEADAVLSPLAPNAVLSTRYDRLPWMRRFNRAWAEAAPDLTALTSADRAVSRDLDREGYRKALLDGSDEEALAALVGELRAGVPVAALIDATQLAAAERFGRYDLDHDLDDTSRNDWLDVTHTLTYADALRWGWQQAPGPEVARGLFHAAWFVRWSGRLDARDTREPAPFVTTDADELRRAVERRDPEAAVAVARGFAGERTELEAVLGQVATDDHHTAPIMIAHTVKVTRAAIAQSRRLGDRPEATIPLAAAARFVASPKRERWVLRSVNDAAGRARRRDRGEEA